MTTQIKNLILDMDGVLWRGETPMTGLVDFFNTLHRLNINYTLATNNATKTAVMYTDKLARFGVTVLPERIVTSAEATAAYLRQEFESGTAVYIIGEKGLHQAITAQGFTPITPEQAENGVEADLVVVGFSRKATYHQLAMGAHLINKGARFIGTNPDPSFPHEMGPLPGCGALLDFIQTGTGVEPTIIGKPGPTMFRQAMQRMGGRPDNTAMVGDRLTTDILGARNAGLKTILVLTGISQEADLESSEVQPDYVFDDINALVADLEANHT